MSSFCAFNGGLEKKKLCHKGSLVGSKFQHYSQIDYHILNVVGIARILAVSFREIPALLRCAHVVGAWISLKLEKLSTEMSESSREFSLSLTG